MLPDPDLDGINRGWHLAQQAGARPAPVPGIIQQVDPEAQGVAWYWATVSRPEVPEHRRAILQFEAVDYQATVWVDGAHVGDHEGVDTPFELDVTDAVRSSRRPDLGIAVRVLHGTDTRIDDVLLEEIPHRNKRHSGYHPGWLHNVGGIVGEVALAVVPEVRIDDVVVRPNLADGSVGVQLMIRSDAPADQSVEVHVSVAPANRGTTADRTAEKVMAAPGVTGTSLQLRVGDVRPWSIEDPYLYRVHAAILADGVIDDRSVRTGFRDFRVTDGWYRLNGRRVLLRSAHTGNHMPIGQTVAPTPDLVRRDLLMAKAAGFTMLRFMAGLAWQVQLDLADEIGMLIYEEPMSAWLLRDSPRMAERFNRQLTAMVRRDRNHPSVVVWGLLTECPDGPVFRHAVKQLPAIRSLDPTRLVMLNSGRFDGQSSIGSVSNPGETTWQAAWGREGPDGPNRRLVPDPSTGWLTVDSWIGGDLSLAGAIEGNGDTHTYPLVPHSDRAIDFLRSLGSGTQPHMLSEYGVGSLMDVIAETRGYEGAAADPALLDAALVRSMADRFEADLVRYGLTDVTPFPRDLLVAAQVHHARHRAIGFDAVRSNPRIAGFNVTGLLDHALTGEGFWTFWRRWKPGIIDVLQEGWAPVRWCLFVQPTHVSVGRPMRLEAVLASDGALAPGRHPVAICLHGPNGHVWSRTAYVDVPREPDPPLAMPVLDEVISAPASAGTYIFAAELLGGAMAEGGRLRVHVAADPEPIRDNTLVGTWGTSDAMDARLAGILGAAPHAVVDAADVIVVGRPNTDAGDEDWEALWSAVLRGATAVCIEPAALEQHGQSLARLPLHHQARCVPFYDWVYHREWVGGRHPLLAGVPDRGILDWDRWGQLLGGPMIEGVIPNLEVAIAAFAVGYSTPGGYASGVTLGTIPYGRGSIILSTLRLSDHPDHPMTGHLLAAMVRSSGSQRVQAP